MTDADKTEWCEGERREVPRSELERDLHDEAYHNSRDRPPHYLNGVPVESFNIPVPPAAPERE